MCFSFSHLKPVPKSKIRMSVKASSILGGKNNEHGPIPETSHQIPHEMELNKLPVRRSHSGNAIQKEIAGGTHNSHEVKLTKLDSSVEEIIRKRHALIGYD